MDARGGEKTTLLFLTSSLDSTPQRDAVCRKVQQEFLFDTPVGVGGKFNFTFHFYNLYP